MLIAARRRRIIRDTVAIALFVALVVATGAAVLAWVALSVAALLAASAVKRNRPGGAGGGSGYRESTSDRAAEIALLREEIAALAERLGGDGDGEDTDTALARERAEVMALAEDEPDGTRVTTLWRRLNTSLEAVKRGAEAARLAGEVTRLF